MISAKNWFFVNKNNEIESICLTMNICCLCIFFICPLARFKQKVVADFFLPILSAAQGNCKSSALVVLPVYETDKAHIWEKKKPCKTSERTVRPKILNPYLPAPRYGLQIAAENYLGSVCYCCAMWMLAMGGTIALSDDSLAIGSFLLYPRGLCLASTTIV